MILPKIMGHRGVAAHAPENTVAGFRRAAALGVPWVEFDAKLTADGRCVLFHDDTLERTTDGRGRVAQTTYDQISRLDAGSWFGPDYRGERVPRLDRALGEVLDLGLHPDIEIKPCPGRETETAVAVMAEVLDHWPSDRSPPLITSIRAESLAVARRVAPSWPRGLICFDFPRDWEARLGALDCRIIACLHRRLTRRRVARIVEAGVKLLAFTVNDAKRAGKLLEWGVTTIISDAPDDLMARL